jgi:DNA-binding protein YbaB
MSSALERLLEEAERTIERSKELEEQLSSLEAEASAAEGRVSVVVGSGGRLKSLTIDPRAMRLGSEELAEAILIAVNGAQEALAQRTQETVGDFWGADSVLGQLAKGGSIDPYEFFASQGVDVPSRFRDLGR